MQHQTSAKSPKDGESSEAVLAMLESCNLSEEDTEMLLTDAYALNKRLREELSRMTTEGDHQVGAPTSTGSAPPRAGARKLPPLRNVPHLLSSSSDRLRDITHIYSSTTGVYASPLASSRYRQDARPASLARKEWQ